MTPSEQINNYLENQLRWQRDNLEMFRSLIHEVSRNNQTFKLEEAWKWDVPVFLVNGKVTYAMSTFKEHTKFNFFYGASLNDRHNLFNSGLDSKKHRSINLKEGETVDKDHLKDLIEQAM